MIQSLKRQTAIIILHTGDSKTLVGASTCNVAHLAAGPASWRGTRSSTPTTTPPTDSRRGSRPTSERIFKSICFLTRFLDRFCHFRFLFGRYQLNQNSLQITIGKQGTALVQDYTKTTSSRISFLPGYVHQALQSCYSRIRVKKLWRFSQERLDCHHRRINSRNVSGLPQSFNFFQEFGQLKKLNRKTE